MLQFGQQKINLRQVGAEFEPGSGTANFCALAECRAHLATAGTPIEEKGASNTRTRVTVQCLCRSCTPPVAAGPTNNRPAA